MVVLAVHLDLAPPGAAGLAFATYGVIAMAPQPSMDYSFFKFLERLERSVRSFSETMSILVSRLKAVIEYFQAGEAALKAELAAAKEALAAALANDAVDDETIAAAQAEAAAARTAADEAAVKAGELQSLVDANTEEKEALSALLDSVELPS